MTTPGMLRINLNSKTLFWVIAISTLLVIAITSMVFQSKVDGIEQQLDQLKPYENQ